MEKEIRELTRQRDIVESRVEGLLQMIGNDQSSSQWSEFVMILNPRCPKASIQLNIPAVAVNWWPRVITHFLDPVYGGKAIHEMIHASQMLSFKAQRF